MDPQQMMSNVTAQGAYDQTDLLLTWGPIEWTLVMILAVFGVGLLIDLVNKITSGPTSALGSEPTGGVSSHRYLMDE